MTDDPEDVDPESVFEQTEVGSRITTQGRTVTGADVVNFAGVSGDFNHLHTDAERMADSGFGERIAHGAFVFSAMTGLLWQNRSVAEREAVVAFYGVDRLRFRAPTFVGDTIHVELEVTEKEPKDHPEGNGVLTYDAEVLNQDDTVVLSCQLRSLVV
ncbi:MaoC/PaaZ C-terminal domain-containing protein [Halomarina rubra]|uniref:MaoC/PaaZ C-terminal domain-containing protein n=1 Tax=Halomarina rubra TaxID=2071873 RepID=A0ABD6ART3_9EURY